MRKIIAIIFLLIFYSNNPVKADDNLKTVYKDGIEHNNVFALLHIEEELERTASSYSVLGITEADFRFKKEEVCRNYLTSAENNLRITPEEVSLAKSVCINETLVSAF